MTPDEMAERIRDLEAIVRELTCVVRAYRSHSRDGRTARAETRLAMRNTDDPPSELTPTDILGLNVVGRTADGQPVIAGERVTSKTDRGEVTVLACEAADAWAQWMLNAEADVALTLHTDTMPSNFREVLDALEAATRSSSLRKVRP